MSNHGELSTMSGEALRPPLVGPQRQGQAAGGVRGGHHVVVAVAADDPLPGGVEVGEVLREVGDVVGRSGAPAASGRTCAGRSRRSRSRARSTTRRTRSGRSSRRTRARGAPPGWWGRRPVASPASRRPRPSRSSANSIVSAVYGAPRTSGLHGHGCILSGGWVRVTGNRGGPRHGRPPHAPGRPAARRRRRSPGATARRRRSGRPATSIASSVPSWACAVATNPGCELTDWWWWQFTESRSPTSPDRRVPGTVVTSMSPELVPAGAVLLVVDQVGRVLVQVPAGVHGHQLHAAADAEHRQAGGRRGVEQRDLPRVPVGAPADRLAGAGRRRSARGRRRRRR